ncbi:MAG: 50S ribosomal protein L11 methyltransferase, partial [Gilliamella apicola]|nr:50S ribosomal protein L11 methyltransferase [Gilliamella apicola]
ELYLAKDIPDNLQADVVVANILAGPLKELEPQINKLVKSHGELGLSGILATQSSSVCSAYQTHFDLDPVVEQDEWCRITGKKK